MVWEGELNSLKKLPLAVMIAGSLLLGGCVSGAKDLTAHPAIGVQLYTVRADMAADARGALRRVAAMGYDEVEFAGLFGNDPAEICAETRALGLKIASSHIDWRMFRDDPAGAIAQTKALCSPAMVLAWMPPEERRTLDQWRWWTAHMNTVAKMADAAGIDFSYHAHDFEFQAIDGVRPIDVIMDGLDPRYADFEIDLYWTVKGGADPHDLIRRYPGRFPLVHVKDMSRTDQSMVDVGDGRIDFAAIFAAAPQAGFRHYLVEHDSAPDPWLSLERSLAYLQALDAAE